MLRLLAASCVIATLAAAPARAGELPRAIGMYTPTNAQLALVESKIEITVHGPIAEAVVTQKFVNRTDRPTEATYVFPLPLDAAVSAMSIDTGTKKIRAAIERREQAQQRYEAAVRAGVAGALLDQERPDVFTQTVAAVPAKGTVAITLRFDTVARFQDGTWELALPLVVAPRYVPGAATNRPTTGTGRAPDTDRAPDASRITPGGSPGAGGATEVVIKFADKVGDPSSPTHDLKVSGNDARFVDPKTDHDAIVRWKTPAASAGWVEQASDGGYAAVVVEAPPAAPRRGTVRWTLVLDRSATSRGDAEASARPLVRGLFSAMGTGDRVQVIGSDQIAWGAGSDVARSVEDRWSYSAGPFDLTRVLEKARPERAPLVLVTGGLVADDRAALAAATKLGVPVHVIGVGPAPARALLTQIAALTGGTVRFATVGDDLGALAKATLGDLASPPAALTVTWGTLAASDVVPGTLPRLGAGQAMLVLARVKKAQTANGRARGELFAIEVAPTSRNVDGATTPMGPLARRWARNRLDELIAARAAPDAIAAHALRYGLVSPYTSMVAVGDEIVVQGGVKRSVAVPVSVPAGMKWQQVKKETTVDPTVDARLSKEKKDADKNSGYANQLDENNRPEKAGERPATTNRRPTTPRPGRPVANNTPKKEPVKVPASKPEPKPAPRDERPQGTRIDDSPGSVPVPTTPPKAPPTDPYARGGRVDPSTGDLGGDDADEKSKKRPAKKAKQSFDGDSAGADDEDGLHAESTNAAAPRTLAYAESEVVMLTGSSTGMRKRWRLATSLSGGVVRSGGESASLFAGGARLEFGVGRRFLAGVDQALWLVDGDAVRGRTLLSFAAPGIARWFELGFGFGFEIGDAVGPAAGVSLRFHLPPAPRASLFLRYDGAVLYNENTRRGQSSGTFGVEWAF